MNQLFFLMNGIVLLAVFSLTTQSVFSNPDQFASNLVEAAFAEDTSRSR